MDALVSSVSAHRQYPGGAVLIDTPTNFMHLSAFILESGARRMSLSTADLAHFAFLELVFCPDIECLHFRANGEEN